MILLYTTVCILAALILIADLTSVLIAGDHIFGLFGKSKDKSSDINAERISSDTITNK